MGTTHLFLSGMDFEILIWSRSLQLGIIARYKLVLSLRVLDAVKQMDPLLSG